MAQLLQYYKKSFQQQPRPQATNLQPTFEDLSIDDRLSELQRLLRYSRSAIGLQRLVHVKMLAHIAANVGFWDTNTHIFPILESVSNDQEPAVRQHLMEQLALLAKFCCEKGGEDGYASVITNILPIIAMTLEDDKPEVRYAASSSLVSIAKLMKPEDLGQHILTIVLQLAHEDEKEDRRMTAALLLNSLAEIMGIDLCKQFVIPEVVSLAEDPVFRVRKSIALNFYNICKIGGEFELFERLMPAFVRLSKDDMYRVRRACAESIAEIAKYVSDDIRVGVLTEIYLRLTQDPSRLVKQSALQQSGMFIASLPRRAVNDSILGNFCSMAMSPTSDTSVDAELRRDCAFSFPAVLQTIGVARWPEVRELYRALVQSRSIVVKQTLAYSLHEVARILNGNEEDNIDQMKGSISASDGRNFEGNKGSGAFNGGVSLVEAELIPIFESMLQDEEVVQMGVMRHLADFLRMLSVPCRVSYLPLLHDILHSTNLLNWRLRQCLAVQLPALLLLPPPELVFTTLFTLVMTLLQDPVANVRKDSFLGVAKMVMILSKQSDYLSSLYNEIEEKDGNLIETISPTGSTDSLELPFNYPNESYHKKKSFRKQYHNIAITAAHHVDIVANAIQTLIQGKSYHLRQLWAELSYSLLLELPKTLFEKYFLDGLLYLGSDPVSNVRVAVAAVLAGWECHQSPAVNDNKDSNTMRSTNYVNKDKNDNNNDNNSSNYNNNDNNNNDNNKNNNNDNNINHNSNSDNDNNNTNNDNNNNNNNNNNDNTNNNSSNNNEHNNDGGTSYLIDNDETIKNIPLLLNPSSPWSWLLTRLDIAQCIMRLSNDDKDVYHEIVKLQPIFPEIKFKIMSCKGMKNAPGGLSPVWNMYTGAYSQALTCVASPTTLLSDSNSSGSDDDDDDDDEENEDDDNECDNLDNIDLCFHSLSEDSNSVSQKASISSHNQNHNHSFTVLPTTEDNADLSIQTQISRQIPIQRPIQIINQFEIPVISDKKSKKSSEMRMINRNNPISENASENAPNQIEKHPLLNKENSNSNSTSTSTSTSTYRGSPINFINSGEVLGKCTGVGLPSPVWGDVNHGFVVRSPARKVEVSAVLLQQQIEEREEERLIHSNTKRILSFGDGNEDEINLSENYINNYPGNLDSHIMSEIELQQESPNVRRRMISNTLFEKAINSYDDSDDDENNNDIHNNDNNNDNDINDNNNSNDNNNNDNDNKNECIGKISSTSQTFSEEAHHIDESLSVPVSVSVSASLSLFNSQQSVENLIHPTKSNDIDYPNDSDNFDENIGSNTSVSPTASSSSSSLSIRNQNQNENENISIIIPPETVLINELITEEQCDNITSNTNIFPPLQQPPESSVTDSVTQDNVNIDI